MSARISSSALAFGAQAVGKSEAVTLSFLEKCSTSSLSEQVIVVGQSVSSFIKSLPSEHSLRVHLDDLVASAPSGGKGWSGSTLAKIDGKKTRMQVFMTPTESSRHNNPFRSDAVTKSLMGQFPDMIVEAAKSSDNRVSVICAVPTAEAVKSMSFSIARALPRFTRKTDRGKDQDASKLAVGVQVSFHIESGESVSRETLDCISTITECIRMSQTLTDAPTNELNVSTYVDFIKEVVATA
jgi:leucyl aminopeptidase